MESLLEFLSFQSSNVRTVLIGTVLLGASAGAVGCFTLLRKQALVGDVVAHSILPGVCIAFLLGESKSPILLLAGALVSGWLSLLLMDYILRRTSLKTDAALGIVLSLFFGLGILLLTAIQQSGMAAQAGLDKFLFGKAASMTIFDVWTFGFTAVLLLILIVVGFKLFHIVSFDPDFAASSGLPVRATVFALSTMTVLAVAVGIQSVGVVLMAALLIAPAAAARMWTNRLSLMLGLAAIVGVSASVGGTYVSFVAPAMPTGPWIVIFLFGLVVVSLLVAPQKGLVARFRRQMGNRQKILLENILKAFYLREERDEKEMLTLSFSELMELRDFQPAQLRSGLQRLTRKGQLERFGNTGWQLSGEGREEAARVVRNHRLWELYLNRKLSLPPDHVHNAAEAMEHLLTPELEAQLTAELGDPELDPHASRIPKPKNQ
jgi:manganese/zinc/iron transport system permease protein